MIPNTKSCVGHCTVYNKMLFKFKDLHNISSVSFQLLLMLIWAMFTHAAVTVKN